MGGAGCVVPLQLFAVFFGERGRVVFLVFQSFSTVWWVVFFSSEQRGVCEGMWESTLRFATDYTTFFHCTGISYTDNFERLQRWDFLQKNTSPERAYTFSCPPQLCAEGCGTPWSMCLIYDEKNTRGAEGGSSFRNNFTFTHHTQNFRENARKEILLLSSQHATDLSSRYTTDRFTRNDCFFLRCFGSWGGMN